MLEIKLKARCQSWLNLSNHRGRVRIYYSQSADKKNSCLVIADKIWIKNKTTAEYLKCVVVKRNTDFSDLVSCERKLLRKHADQSIEKNSRHSKREKSTKRGRGYNLITM
ncbi:hypothetical protein RF11_05365 [Thelohanellus kitauei]|uniref:Uncharacterized protein n=1 Tax=Thelohanellus kitauei TaxID=669202 RepID=A0A0C2MQW5_THEKT|nr:hypothetical protein RF11_05365 [Thelohanellus kitauei]